MQTFAITHYPWDKFNYQPKTSITLEYTPEGYQVHMTSYETELRTEETAHNGPICQDSCMEAFINFTPDASDSYLNFEVNPKGIMHLGFGNGRHGRILAELCDIEKLQIKPEIFSDRWEVSFLIPTELIKKKFPAYTHLPGKKLKGNFYKCGDLSVFEHFGCWAPITWEEPDFHRPEFFREFTV